MRLAAAIKDVLSRELATREALQQVTVARVQSAPWDWIVFSMVPSADHATRTLLSHLVPLRAGELLMAVGSGTAFHSPQGVITESRSEEDHVVRQILSDSPAEIRLAVDPTRSSFRGSTVFVRLQRDRSLSDANSIARSVRDSTWFGFRSLPATLQHRHVDIVLGAQSVRLATLDNDPIASSETGDTLISIFSSTATATVTVRTLTGDGCSGTFKLPAAQVAAALGVSLRKYYGFDVNLPLDAEVLTRDVHLRRANAVAVLKSCAPSLGAARERCEEAIGRGIDDTIRLLEKRRQQSRRRSTVGLVDESGSSSVLGTVPTNENEVLILTGKLESHISQILPVFCVWEHTSQIGIDALADIQLSRDSAPIRNATVEFEFQLASFFEHSHPIRQTEFIVCWTHGDVDNGTHSYGDGGLDRRGELQFEMRGTGWIRFLDFGDHLIRVLILRHLPGLRVESPVESRV